MLVPRLASRRARADPPNPTHHPRPSRVQRVRERASVRERERFHALALTEFVVLLTKYNDVVRVYLVECIPKRFNVDA